MKSKFMIFLGVILIILSINMKSATYVQKNKLGTFIAGLVGAGTGAGIGAAIGGIGIAACGTGVGVPFGAVCLGLSAIFGGTSAGIFSKFSTKTLPVYSPWVWCTILIIGIILIIMGFSDNKKKIDNNENNV